MLWKGFVALFDFICVMYMSDDSEFLPLYTSSWMTTRVSGVLYLGLQINFGK